MADTKAPLLLAVLCLFLVSESEIGTLMVEAQVQRPDCGPKCASRCSKSWKPEMCLQTCTACCNTCEGCVPAGPIASKEHIISAFTSCDDLLKKKQFCYILARHGKYLKLDDYMCQDSHDRILLSDIINNATLSESYLTLARDVEVMEPKSPEDIYKVHLLDDRAIAGASVDSARQNLAATFVNAFVNAGFGQDKLMTVPADSSNGGSSGNWVFKNKEHGKISVAASLGTILLWDTDIGLAQIDKFIHSNGNYVIAGALLGVGLVNCNVYSHLDPARGILHEYIDNEDSSIRIGAIMGLGIAYAVPLALGLLCMSNPKVNVVDILSRLSHDTYLEVVMPAIISLGLIGAGTNNARIVFMLRNLSSYYYRIASLLFCVQIAQGLVHLGKGLLTLDPYHCDHFLLSPRGCKAGQPKTITGFQTFTTLVLLAAGQRAELATEKYIPLTPTLEGHVILIENPEYMGDN
ncbi:hypothetical protein V6N13_121007 [Hibiscus sabdariffa]